MLVTIVIGGELPLTVVLRPENLLMVKVSLTGAISSLQSFKSIVIVAVSHTVWAGLASEYHSVATPGETPMLAQVCPEELDEAGAETEGVITVVGAVELTTEGAGV